MPTCRPASAATRGHYFRSSATFDNRQCVQSYRVIIIKSYPAIQPIESITPTLLRGDLRNAPSWGEPAPPPKLPARLSALLRVQAIGQRRFLPGFSRARCAWGSRWADVRPHSAQVSILYWMRHTESWALVPFFVLVDDLSVLPLCTLSLAPPAHCVPANLTMAMEFQPELHCRIAELPREPATSHDEPAASDPIPDSDLKVGLGLTVRTPGDLLDLTPAVLVYQWSPTTPLSSSPLASSRRFPPHSERVPRKRILSAEL